MLTVVCVDIDVLCVDNGATRMYTADTCVLTVFLCVDSGVC